MISISTRSTFLSRFLFVVFFAVFIVSTAAFSQGKFLDGYVISSKGDTLKGLIRYEGWDQSPLYIDFRDSQSIRKLNTKEITEFYIDSLNTRYLSRKIGIVNITLKKLYSIPPTLETKDSLVIFLREVTSGPKATLLEDINASGDFHYYLEKDHKLVELIYYPFYRLANDKKTLLKYDNYKNQLPDILSDAKNFKAKLPYYGNKSLQRYIEKYNKSFNELAYSHSSGQEYDFTVDLIFQTGLESWREPSATFTNKLFYGFGARVNLPRKLHNRYIRMNLSLIPGMANEKIYGGNNTFPDKSLSTLTTWEIGAGSHFGYKKFKALAGMDVSFPIKPWRTVILGPRLGISYLRKFSLEISHFANLYFVFSDIPFFNRPNISLNYYLNLNTLFKKK